MKMNETHILPLAAALVAMVFPAGLQAADYALTAADGARFLQLDFPDKNPPLSDFAVGMLETNLLLLRASSGIPSGYVNVVLDDNSVVRMICQRFVPGLRRREPCCCLEQPVHDST